METTVKAPQIVEGDRALQLEKCINCSDTVTGRYCAGCGQRQGVKRITFRGLLEEFWYHWIGFDNQFGRTLIQLTIRPGRVVQAYLNGNRVAYIGPLGYYFVVSALVILSFSVIGIEHKAFLEASGSMFSVAPSSEKEAIFQEQYMNLISSAFRFLVILFIPFYAAVSILMFRKEKLNYWEHGILFLYSSAHMFWLTLLQAVVYKVSGEMFNITALLLALAYYGFFFQQVFPQRNKAVVSLKGAGAYIFGSILAVLTLIIIGVILMVAYKIMIK